MRAYFALWRMKLTMNAILDKVPGYTKVDLVVISSTNKYIDDCHRHNY